MDFQIGDQLLAHQQEMLVAPQAKKRCPVESMHALALAQRSPAPQGSLRAKLGVRPHKAEQKAPSLRGVGGGACMTTQTLRQNVVLTAKLN